MRHPPPPSNYTHKPARQTLSLLNWKSDIPFRLRRPSYGCLIRWASPKVFKAPATQIAPVRVRCYAHSGKKISSGEVLAELLNHWHVETQQAPFYFLGYYKLMITKGISLGWDFKRGEGIILCVQTYLMRDAPTSHSFSLLLSVNPFLIPSHQL